MPRLLGRLALRTKLLSLARRCSPSSPAAAAPPPPAPRPLLSVDAPPPPPAPPLQPLLPRRCSPSCPAAPPPPSFQPTGGEKYLSSASHLQTEVVIPSEGTFLSFPFQKPSRWPIPLTAPRRLHPGIRKHTLSEPPDRAVTGQKVGNKRTQIQGPFSFLSFTIYFGIINRQLHEEHYLY